MGVAVQFGDWIGFALESLGIWGVLALRLAVHDMGYRVWEFGSEVLVGKDYF